MQQFYKRTPSRSVIYLFIYLFIYFIYLLFIYLIDYFKSIIYT